MKTALITGITGQDGSYLAEFLLEKGYRVAGLVRRTSSVNVERIAGILDRIELVSGDLMDGASLVNALRQVQPDEIYNLAAQSFVPASWAAAEYTSGVTGVGVVRMLEAMRLAAPRARFYQASSSEMFGKVRETPQRETTPFYPRSPYGCAKAFGHYATVNYRESYGLFAVSGICFNHESPRRGLEFVSRKIAHGVGQIARGQATELRLGNLDALRDWGYAPDYVRAMWMMLQRNEPEDFVIGSGVSYSVGFFCQSAFACAGLDWNDYVKVDEKFMRPAEVAKLRADPSKARAVLGWKPDYSFADLVAEMVKHELL